MAALAALLLLPLAVPAQKVANTGRLTNAQGNLYSVPELINLLKAPPKGVTDTRVSDELFFTLRYRVFGNKGMELAPIYAMLTDPDAQHRAIAAKLLGRLRDPHAVDLLLRMLLVDDEASRFEAALALVAIHDPKGLAAVAALRVSPVPQFRLTVIDALRQTGGKAELDAIAGLLDDKESSVRMRATVVLAQAGDPRGRQALLALMADPQQPLDTRLSTAMFLADRHTPELVEPLVASLKEGSAWQSQTAIMTLAKIGDAHAVQPLLPYLQADDRRTQREAIKAMISLGDPRGTAAARQLYEAESIDRREYGNLLAGVRNPGDVDLLLACIEHVKSDGMGMDMQLTATIHALAAMGAPATERLAALLRDGADPELRRTAAYLCSEVRDARLVPALLPLLQDEDDEIRMLAADALCRLADARAIEPLAAAMRESSPRVRLNIVRQLGDFRDPAIIPLAAEALQDPDDGIRRAALWSLWWLKDPAVIPVVRPMLEDPNWLVRYAAVDVLHQSGGKLWVVDLQGRLYDPRADVRRNAAIALRADGTLEAFNALLEAATENPDLVEALNYEEHPPVTAPETINRLLAAAKGGDPQACALALNALSGVTDARVTAAALARLADTHDVVRAGAMRALAGVTSEQATTALIAGLRDPSDKVKTAAVQSLGKGRVARAVPSLVALLGNDDQRIPNLTLQALGEIKGPQATDALIDALEHETSLPTLIPALQKSDDPRAVPVLLTVALTSDSYFAKDAFTALAAMKDLRVVEMLRHFDPNELFNSRGDAQTRATLMKLYAQMGDTRIIPALLEMLHSEDAGCCIGAAEALGQLKATAAVDDLIAELDRFTSPDQGGEGFDGCFTHGNILVTTREKVASALGAIGDPRAVEPLIASLGRGTMASRGASATALSVLGDKRAVAPLIAEIPNLTGEARKAAFASLRKLTGQDFGADIARWQQWQAKE